MSGPDPPQKPAPIPPARRPLPSSPPRHPALYAQEASTTIQAKFAPAQSSRGLVLSRPSMPQSIRRAAAPSKISIPSRELFLREHSPILAPQPTLPDVLMSPPSSPPLPFYSPQHLDILYLPAQLLPFSLHKPNQYNYRLPDRFPRAFKYDASKDAYFPQPETRTDDNDLFDEMVRMSGRIKNERKRMLEKDQQEWLMRKIDLKFRGGKPPPNLESDPEAVRREVLKEIDDGVKASGVRGEENSSLRELVKFEDSVFPGVSKIARRWESDICTKKVEGWGGEVMMDSVREEFFGRGKGWERWERAMEMKREVEAKAKAEREKRNREESGAERGKRNGEEWEENENLKRRRMMLGAKSGRVSSEEQVIPRGAAATLKIVEDNAKRGKKYEAAYSSSKTCEEALGERVGLGSPES